MRPYRGQPNIHTPADAEIAQAIKALAATTNLSSYTVMGWLQRRGRRVLIRVSCGDKLGILDEYRQAAREFRQEEAANGGVHPLCEVSAEATLQIAIDCLLDPRPQAGHQLRDGATWFRSGVPDGVRRFFRDQVEARYKSAQDFDIAGYLPDPPLRRLIRHKVVGIVSQVRAALEIAPHRRKA